MTKTIVQMYYKNGVIYHFDQPCIFCYLKILTSHSFAKLSQYKTNLFQNMNLSL